MAGIGGDDWRGATRPSPALPLPLSDLRRVVVSRGRSRPDLSTDFGSGNCSCPVFSTVQPFNFYTHTHTDTHTILTAIFQMNIEPRLAGTGPVQYSEGLGLHGGATGKAFGLAINRSRVQSCLRWRCVTTLGKLLLMAEDVTSEMSLSPNQLWQRIGGNSKHELRPRTSHTGRILSWSTQDTNNLIYYYRQWRFSEEINQAQSEYKHSMTFCIRAMLS